MKTQPGTQSPKPRVWIHYSSISKTIEVKGDTYPVKELLKSLGFKWRDGVWVRENATPGDIPKAMEELGKVANIAVTPLKDAVESLVRTIELISTVASKLDGDLAVELEEVQSMISEVAKRLRGLQERVDKKLLGS